jgi:hypothetical protein
VVIPWSGQQLIDEVDAIFDRARNQVDLQVQSDYAKYLVVRVSGLVEQVVTEIVVAHVSARASPTVINHLVWRMRTFQNPTVERILQLVGSFDREWRERLNSNVTEAERQALGSINVQRNLVAHGGPSTISLGQVSQYYAEIMTVLRKIADLY